MAISDFIGRKPVWRNFRRLASYQRCSLIGADNEPVFLAVVNSWSLLCGETLCFYVMGVSEALTLGRVKVCKHSGRNGPCGKDLLDHMNRADKFRVEGKKNVERRLSKAMPKASGGAEGKK